KLEINDDVYVIPSNISTFIPEKIDRELFNITSLIDQGYDDTHSDNIPLIISFNETKSLNTSIAKLSESVSENHVFSSIDAIAAEVDKNHIDSFTDSLFTTKENSLESTGLLENNIKQIRLDRKVEVDLEDSVPKFGVPRAWESDYDGEGTSVAVVDSGIDEG